MRAAALVLLVTATACATTRPATPASPATRAGLAASTSRARAEGPAGSIVIEKLPAAFARLSPRDRERWHACHVLFLERREPRPGESRAVGVRLGFSVRVADYVALPDEDARRAFLIARGCPPSLVDLADGTHLDMIEGDAPPTPPAMLP